MASTSGLSPARCEWCGIGASGKNKAAVVAWFRLLDDIELSAYPVQIEYVNRNFARASDAGEFL